MESGRNQQIARRPSASMKGSKPKPAGGTVLQRLNRVEELSRNLREFQRMVERGRAKRPAR
jgi:hypothetical protein